MSDCEWHFNIPKNSNTNHLDEVFDILGRFEDESDTKLTVLQQGFSEEMRHYFQGAMIF